MRAFGWPGLAGLFTFCGGVFVSGCAVSHRMAPISPCGPPPEPHEITWYGPLEPRDRHATEERCRTVGPPVVIHLPGAPFRTLTQQDSLAIFSWNMDVGAGDLLSFLHEEVGLTCAGAETQASATFPHFVVLLQEAFRRSADLPPLNDSRLAARKSVHDPHPDGDPDLLEIARVCGLAALYVASGRNGADAPGEKLLDKGNAILSTLPISDFLAVENPFETERKVAVGASIHTPDSARLRLISAHLEVASTFHRALLTGNQTRPRQAAGLIEALAAIEEDTGSAPPTVVGGDFNTWSGGESTLKMMGDAFPESPSWDGHTTRGLFPTDHIFFRRGREVGSKLVSGSYSWIEKRYDSDHQARFVWIRFGSE